MAASRSLRCWEASRGNAQKRCPGSARLDGLLSSCTHWDHATTPEKEHASFSPSWCSCNAPHAARHSAAQSSAVWPRIPRIATGASLCHWHLLPQRQSNASCRSSSLRLALWIRCGGHFAVVQRCLVQIVYIFRFIVSNACTQRCEPFFDWGNTT